MFLKSFPKAIKKSSIRLAVWYSGFFVSSSVLILFATYFFLSSALKFSDQQEILSEIKRLASQYDVHGISSLQGEEAEITRYRGKDPFFIRLADGSNKTLHVFDPQQWYEFDLHLLESASPSDEGSWIYLHSIREDFELMIASTRLKDGRRLQVGLTSEIRDRMLERYEEVFLIIMLPLVLIGFAGGIFFAQHTLRPIRHIIQTVQSIVTGNMAARVHRTGIGDELDELAKLFNEMLDRINTLIIGMKDSLDNVAHDLRTPMTRFRNILETALQTDQNSDLCREALSDGIEESDRILNMLATLMDISEAETGVMTLDREAVDIASLLDVIIDMYQYVAEEKGVELIKNLPDHLTISVDPNRMSQALANILDNAVKYTPRGGRVTLRAYRTEKECIVQVIDTGVGIPLKDLHRIWDRLYRGDSSRSTKGLGLGLNFVKAIVQAHNGRVEVSSTPGTGSCFTIFLPNH